MAKQRNNTSENGMKKTSRRAFLRNSAALAGGSALIAACGPDNQSSEAQAPSGEKRTLTMVTTWPKNFPGLGTGAERIAKRIETLSAGRIKVRVYAAGELVGALGVFDAVAQGSADLYHGAEYYFQGKSPAFSFFAAVPMGMIASEMASWIRFGGGQELWDELSAQYGVKPFMAGNSGTQMGGWFAKKIQSEADLKGLRIRMPGLGGEVFRRLGASPITLPGGEIFQALSQGNIDATEWVGPWNDLQFGFHTVVKNYYYSGIHEPGTTLSMGMNKNLWDSMDATDREIIQVAADAENDIMLSEFNARNAEALRILTEEHGVKLRRFNDDLLKRMADVSKEVLQEAAASDELTGRVYESFKKARALGSGWGKIAERTFADVRDLSDL